MDQTTDDPDLIDLAEAATLLGVSERTVWRLDGKGLDFVFIPIPITRQHPVRRVKRAQVLALKAKREGREPSEAEV